MCSCNNQHANGCPSAGYPTPSRFYGCGGSGYNPGPFPPMPGPAPQAPIPGGTVPTLAGLGGMLEDLAVRVGVGIATAANRLGDNGMAKAGCGPWKTDGVNDHKLCCTPSVGRAGIKVAACIKISRPHDPWATQTPLGLQDTPPSWPVPM